MKKNISFSIILFLTAWLLAFLSVRVLGQQSHTGSVHFSEPYRQTELPAPMNSYPFRYWDKGYLITYTADYTSKTTPAVVLYDRDGHIAQQAYVWFKDAASTSISDAAVTDSGKLVVAGGTESPVGAIANFIAEIDDTGHMGRVIRTTPFLPVYICAGDDRTVWSYGFDRDENGEGVEGSAILRQYGFGKGQIRAMLNDKFSLHSAWSLTRGRYPGELNLRCNSHEVGIFNGAASEWIELDIPTNSLKVFKVNPLPPPKQMRILGFALTESGDVFVSLHDRSSSPPRSGIFHLTFDSSGVGSWTPVANSVGPYLRGGPVERLLGADGDTLVYTHDQNGETYWSKFTK
jgi:hypothetical protein